MGVHRLMTQALGQSSLIFLAYSAHTGIILSALITLPGPEFSTDGWKMP